jgi:hypothetical protein
MLLTLVTTPAAAQSAAAAPVIRVHAHSADNERQVHVVAIAETGANQRSCSSEAPRRGQERWGDCIVDVPAGTQLSIKLGNLEPPHVYWVPENRGNELDLKVVSDDENALVAGGALIVAGGLGIALGFLGFYLSSSCGHCADDTTLSLGATAVGAVLITAGVGVVAARSREPRVETLRPRRAAESTGPTVTAPAALTPLGYTFRF